MKSLKLEDLIHDWSKPKKRTAETLDTSLRDGLQDPSIKQPSLEEKLKLVNLMSKIGIEAADIGFPINSKEHKSEIIEIAKHIRKNKLGIKISVLARTQIPDIKAAIDVSQKAGVPIEAMIMVGSSKVRHFVEEWNLKEIDKWMKDSIDFAVKNDIEVNFATEDSTRTDPETLKTLFSKALEHGAKRVILADTVGASTPEATKNIVKYLKKEVIKNTGVPVDWHGHNDRDLATANSLAAIKAGASRCHVTALGIGERAGNSPTESYALNIHMKGWGNYNLEYLQEYSEQAAKMFRYPIPENTPVVGKYAHTTSVGIHAAAVVKARDMAREDLANTVYSGVDPQLLGRRTEIFVGPLSGKANVNYILQKHKIEVTEEKIKKILSYARKESVILKDETVIKITKDIS